MARNRCDFPGLHALRPDRHRKYRHGPDRGERQHFQDSFGGAEEPGGRRDPQIAERLRPATRDCRFDGGTDLSGGEWQKLALARAYLREAQVLILDEPTASLDAKSEHEVFERFAELTRGKMAMLISHRFSTVRMADRIFVLQGGRIAEEGPHDQLMQNGGRYAEMFELQAASYR